MSEYVVVTGASRGIGLAIARRILSGGGKVIGVSRTPPSDDQFVTLAREPTRATWLRADVSDYAAFAVSVERLPQTLPLRALVLNAGWGEWHVATKTPIDHWDGMVGTNLSGAFYATRLFMQQRFSLSPHFQILAISSDASLRSFRERAAYCSSKAGMAMFVDCLRDEVREMGYRVTEIVSSRVDTTFRNRPAGSRPGSLQPDQIAALVDYILRLEPAVEVRRVEVSALKSAFGC